MKNRLDNDNAPSFPRNNIFHVMSMLGRLKDHRKALFLEDNGLLKAPNPISTSSECFYKFCLNYWHFRFLPKDISTQAALVCAKSVEKILPVVG